MAPHGETETDSNRFDALLNPIRDIAASWGVDVAKELTEYAESLGINIGDTDPNDNHQSEVFMSVDFAKAALLVQGSTSIYSRKVEHLYSLVYIAVSALNQMNGKNNDTSGDASATLKDADADALLQLDEIDFLTLDDDDVPQVDPKTISLPDESERQSRAYRDETCLLPVPPMLAHRSIGPSDQVGGVDYKMLSADVHPSGALIMRGCPPVNEDLDKLPSEGNEDCQSTQPFDNHFVDDDDGGGDDFAPPSPFSISENLAESRPVQDEEEVLETASQVTMKIASMYGIEPSRKEPSHKREKRKENPFLMLDPHEAVAELDKPLTVGRTYRKPRQSGPNWNCVPHFWIRSESDSHFTILPEIPANASVKRYISLPSLQTSFTSILRKRSAAKRKRIVSENGELNADTEDTPITAEFADDDIFSAPDVDRGCEEYPAEFENDVDGDFDSENLPLDNAFDEIHQTDATGLLLNTEEQLGEELISIASSFEETCRKHLERTAWMWEQRATDAELLRRVDEWKSRIQPLLEEEERREEFDISLYGKRIVNILKAETENKDTEEVRISQLIRHSAKFEVCRMFLATLQLANNYKIEIVPYAESNVSDFYVRMLAGQQDDKERAAGAGMQVPSKRCRQPGSTPKSVKRPPLRPRFLTQNSMTT